MDHQKSGFQMVKNWKQVYGRMETYMVIQENGMKMPKQSQKVSIFLVESMRHGMNIFEMDKLIKN